LPAWARPGTSAIDISAANEIDFQLINPRMA